MKKRLIKILSLLFIMVLVFEIYTYGKTDKIYYVALGDSLAAGENSYGEIGYGYTDYIEEYLTKKKHLAYYKKYAKSGYETNDIKENINNNLKLKKDLRESDLVTISIGANDLLHGMDLRNFKVSRLLELRNKIEKVIPNLDNCLKEIRKYAKERIIIVGYYNPIPILFDFNSKEIDELFAYIDNEYMNIAKKYHCDYISIYELIKKNNKKYLPNPYNIHPSVDGYKAIANKIIKENKKLALS